MTDGSDQSLDEINTTLYAQGMTDGLPILPPTEERVAEMLRGTDLPGEHVLGTLGNNENPLTVEALASNAVMAGCLPTYMPLLVAGAEALADPNANTIQSSVSTGSWAYSWIVNGPIREAINVQSGTNAFGPYFRANRTIARALGLAYKNTAKLFPGEKDMGVVGNPAKFSFLGGEHEEQSPWEPYHVTHGFDADASTITLFGPNSFLNWLPRENTAEGVLAGMIRNTPNSMRAFVGEDWNGTIVHALNPYNAEELEKADLTKREIKEYLVENSYRVEDSDTGMFTEEAAKVPPRQTPQYGDPEAIKLVTVGGPGRWSAIIGMSAAGPVTKEVDLPSEWDALVEEYTIDLEWYEDMTY